MTALGTRLRPLALVLLVAALGVGCWSWFAEERTAALGGGAALPTLLGGLAAAVVQVALGWLLVLTVLVATEPWSGHALTSYAGCPAGLRRALLGLCGAAVVGALALPAGAAPAPAAGPEADPPGGDRVAAVLDGLPVPDRPTGAPARTARERRVQGQGQGQEKTPPARVIVRPGDSLWRIARDHLPADAGAATVTRTWRAIHAANRSLIGPDPDLIQPGTRLRLPTKEETR